MGHRSPVDGVCQLQTRCSQSAFIVEGPPMFKADVGRLPLRKTGPLWKPTLVSVGPSNVRLLGRPTGAVDPFRSTVVSNAPPQSRHCVGPLAADAGEWTDGRRTTHDRRRTTDDIDEGRRLRDEARQIRRGLGASVARPREQRRRR